MGADSCAVYYGVRYQVTDKLTGEQLRNHSHPLMVAATKVGLEYRWCDSPVDGDEFQIVLIGREIGIFGLEYIVERKIPDAEMHQIMEEVREKLRLGAFELEPSLQVLFEPDF